MRHRKHVEEQTGRIWKKISPQEVGDYLRTYSPIRAGYEEARRGAPHDPDAYATDHGCVIRYEEGRLMASMLKGLGDTPPPWGDPSRPPEKLVVKLADELRNGGGI